MANPFLRRATEYIRDEASFLGIVSPAPLTTFLLGVAVGRGATLEAAAGTASALLLAAAEPPTPPTPS